MKHINVEIARECKAIAENWIFEGNTRGFNLSMGFHLSNEEILGRPTSKTFKVSSITDASEIIASYYNDNYDGVLERVNIMFLNEVNIYKPLFLHFMTQNGFNLDKSYA